MNDPQLAAARRSRSPDALPELLDAYGDQLFSYCWCLLRNRENEQIAVRDVLVVATARIGLLVCDEWLGLRLYSVEALELEEPRLPGSGGAAERLDRYHHPETSTATAPPVPSLPIHQHMAVAL